MGNRATITTINPKKDTTSIYLHWNGGRDSVEAFLKYCELKNYRTPDSDSYGMARLAQIIGNFIGGTNSIGVSTYERLSGAADWDNGTYLIKGWKIAGRENFFGIEQNNYDLEKMLINIDEAQPKKEQLGIKFIKNSLDRRSDKDILDEYYSLLEENNISFLNYYLNALGVYETSIKDEYQLTIKLAKKYIEDNQ